MSTADRSSSRGEDIDHVRRRIDAGDYVVDAMDVADAILRAWSMRDVVESFEETRRDASGEADQSAVTSG